MSFQEKISKYCLFSGNAMPHAQLYPTLCDSLVDSPAGSSVHGVFQARIPEFSSAAQSCPTLCNPMYHSTPGLRVHNQLPEFMQTQVHRVGDAIQPSHPMLSPSSPTLNLPQHQCLFTRVSSSHQAAKILEFQLQPYAI